MGQYEPRPMSACGPSQYEPRPMSAFSGPSQYKQRPIGTTGDMRLAGRPMRQVQEMRERILQMNNGMWAIRREAVVLEVDQCLLYNLVWEQKVGMIQEGFASSGENDGGVRASCDMELD